MKMSPRTSLPAPEHAPSSIFGRWPGLLLVGLTSLGLLGFWAAADPFGVAPTLIEMSVSVRTATVRVTNPSAQAVKYEVTASTWSQQSGDDVYTPTTEIVLTPPVFLLKPGGSQIVRVGLKTPAVPSAPERAFRIFVAQLATPQTQPTAAELTTADQVRANLRILFKLALPMFVLPASPTPKTDWTVRREGPGTQVTLNNTGNSYVRFAGLRVMQGDKLIGTKAVMYGLAGQHHTIILNVPVEPGKVTISYEVDQEPHTEVVAVQ